MAVKIAKSMGATVTLFSTSPSKESEAKKLGADFVLSSDDKQFQAAQGTFDKLFSTIAASFDINKFLNLLKVDGELILLGVGGDLKLNPGALIFKRIKVGGSLIGSVQEVQEMLDYCASKKIVADIEKVPLNQVNDALQKVKDNTVSHRIVLVHPEDKKQ